MVNAHALTHVLLFAVERRLAVGVGPRHRDGVHLIVIDEQMAPLPVEPEYFVAIASRARPPSAAAACQ